MDEDWHFEQDGVSYGPTMQHHVARLARENAGLLVWRPGFDRWVEARDVPELLPRLPTTPPPLPGRTVALSPQGGNAVTVLRPYRVVEAAPAIDVASLHYAREPSITTCF